MGRDGTAMISHDIFHCPPRQTVVVGPVVGVPITLPGSLDSDAMSIASQGKPVMGLFMAGKIHFHGIVLQLPVAAPSRLVSVP